MYSKLIKNGKIIDGTGAPAFVGDIAIEQDKIAAIGRLERARAQEIIDATDCYVAPGFIDIQNHSDVYWAIFDNPALDSLVAQGITTALIGNCGASLAPLLSRDALLSIQKWHNLERVNLNWLTFKEFGNELSKRNFGVNLASLVGHSTLRRGLIKNEVRQLNADEQKILAKALEQSLEQGAFGLSAGLAYAHEAETSWQELADLAKIVAKSSGLVSLHLRSEAAGLLESVEEAINIARQSGSRLQISHLKARGKENWHLLDQSLSLIETAYQQNVPVNFDLYPYDFVWQAIYTYLPSWAYQGGRDLMISRLKNPRDRQKILAYLNSKDLDYSQILVASTSLPLNIAGKSLGEIGRRHELTAAEALLTIIENGGSEVLVFDRNLQNAQVEQLLAHPLAMVASDGAGFKTSTQDKLVHPRCFGAMPRFLNLAIQKKLLPLEKAVQKITQMPAQKIGLSRRGVLAVDNFADVVVFDQDIDSKADWSNPFRYPTGIREVLVNGSAALQRGELNPRLSGRMLRK